MVVKVLIQWRLKRPCTWQAIGACYVRETGRTVVVFASWDDGFLMTPSHDLLVNAMVIAHTAPKLRIVPPDKQNKFDLLRGTERP